MTSVIDKPPAPIGVHSHRTPAQRAREAELCMGYQLQGYTYRQIEEKLWDEHDISLSPAGIKLRIETAIANLPTADAKKLRKRELARCDALEAAIADQVAAGDLNAVKTALRVMDRRARYLGLDAPTLIKGELDVTHDVSEDVAALIEQARQQVAAREASMKAIDNIVEAEVISDEDVN